MRGEIKNPQAIKVIMIVLWIAIVILAGMLLGFLIVSCSKLTSKPAATLTSISTSLSTPTPQPPTFTPTLTPPPPSTTPVPPASPPTSIPGVTNVPPTTSPSLQTPSPGALVETETPTAQPIIDHETNDPGQCLYHTHLTYGMYAFVRRTIYIYDMPRYEQKSGYEDPKIIFTLHPGDRVWITTEYFPSTIHRDAKNPQCSRSSYWWYVLTAFEDPVKDPHFEGWVFEYYYQHPKDDYAYFNEGYYLGPNKP